MTDQDTPQKPSNPVRMDFDRLAAVFAVALSIAAILVSLLEVSAARSQQQASVWPYIDMSGSYSDEGFQLILTNKGVGPARMGDVNILLDGQIADDLDSAILAILGEEDAFSYDVYRATNPSRNVIAKGETVRLFAVPWEARTRKLMSEWDERIEIRGCYCSIYEECWVASTQSRSTKPTQVCEID